MSAADSFTFFGALPLELRLQIWREALSVRTVWAAIRNPTSVDHPQFSMAWVDMDHTVVYLGDFSDAMKVMDSFHADDLCRFKHVALGWSQFDRLARACQRLARTCPALCTIIVHQAETKAQAVADGPFSRSLSLETATNYATIPSHNNSELGYKGLDTDYLRSLLLAYFGASPPRLHMLPPDLADSSHWS